ncbi:MAG: zinc-ribbon domain containing protein [bacterium]
MTSNQSFQSFKDKILVCADCREQFIFSTEYQEFYYQKNFPVPKKCPACASNRKQNSSNKESYNTSKIQCFIRCSICGIQTIVHFEPLNNEPVCCSYCSNTNLN